MAENVGLLYPIYLDIPMMVSFVATIEGGYALENVLKLSHDISGDASAQLEGEAGLSNVGLANILSNFVKADLKGTGSVEGKLARTEESQIVLKHTEASIFMRLRHELRRQGRIVSLDECEQEQWKHLQPSQPSELVEISGYIERSPINEIIRIGERFMPFIIASLPQKDGNVDTSNLNKEQMNSLAAITLIQAMRADITSSPITDMVLRHKSNWGKSAVLDLSTKILPFGEEERLLCGRVVVLGKATRVLANDENINLYRRSIFNYATKDIKTQMVTDFNKMTGVDVQLSSPIVSYPAIEIIPMAIYV